MKHFLIFIIKIVLVTFLLLVILDVAYTKVYLQTDQPRENWTCSQFKRQAV